MKKLVYMSNCPIVEGVVRDSIYDLTRSKMYFIPKSLTGIIQEHARKSTLTEIKNEYAESSYVVDEYFHFLIENDLVFFTEDADHFSDLNLTWDSPYIFSNAIIEVNNLTTENYIGQLLNKLSDVGCPYIELRVKGQLPNELMSKIIEFTNSSNIRGLYIVIENVKFYSFERLQEIAEKSLKLISFSVYSAKETITKEIIIRSGKRLNAYYDSRSIADSPQYSVSIQNISMDHFVESQEHNTFFNRKIIIDANGEILNYFGVGSEKFGNILTTKLEKLAQNESYTKYWQASKQKIEVCKVCEYRNRCIDSRVPIKSENNNWEYKSECDYNPFIGKWKGEKGYSSVNEMKY